MPSWKVPGKGWRYRFQYEGQKYGRGFYSTKTEAKAAEAEHKKSLKEEMSKEIPSGFVQFSEQYLDFWMRRSEGDSQAKTFKEKKFIHKSFLAHLGRDLNLYEITPLIIEGYLKTRPTNSNWNQHRKNLCAFFQWCFKRGLITQNPCLHVEIMPTNPCRKIIPSQDDIVRLFMAAGELRTFFLALYSRLPGLGRSIGYAGKILILNGAWLLYGPVKAKGVGDLSRKL